MRINISRAEAEAAFALPARAELYRPAASWWHIPGYPSLTPPAVAPARQDERLTWELLRRLPLYRHHYAELKLKGALGSREFQTGRSFYTSNSEIPDAAWDIVLDGHATSDPFDESRTFRAFRANVTRGTPWWIQHGHDWACRFWAVDQVFDPDQPFSKVPRTLFRNGIELFDDARLDASPAAAEVVMSQFERVAVIRLDLSIDRQLDLLGKRLKRSQAGFWRIDAAASPGSFKPTHPILWPLKLLACDAFRHSAREHRDWKAMQGQVRQVIEAAAASASAKWGDLPVVDDTLDARTRKKATLKALLDSALKRNFVADWVDQFNPLICDPKKDFAYRFMRANLL